MSFRCEGVGTTVEERDVLIVFVTDFNTLLEIDWGGVIALSSRRLLRGDGVSSKLCISIPPSGGGRFLGVEKSEEIVSK